MASDWIKMRVDLSEQVEVVQMTALLKMDAYGVIGRLHKLWAWVDKNSLDGQKMPITFAWIDEYVSCKNFANSLQKSGWLKGKDGAISFPNFERHNGKTAKERAVSNRRVEKFRETDSKRNGNANVTPPPLQKPLPEEESDKKTKTNTSQSETTSSVSCPTLEECQAFALTEFSLNGSFASRFFSKHSANGWLDGKGEPIRDWRKMMRGLVNSMSVIERDQFTKKPKPDQPDNSLVKR